MSTAEQMVLPDFAAARRHMVECQIRPNKVQDENVLTAMETIPREIFVPPALAGIAYIDEDLQVAKGRYLMEPMVLARLLEAADIKLTDNVLDIAPATGYSTAVIAAFAQKVVGLESDGALQSQAANNIARLGVKNAHVHLGSLSEGYESEAPYNVIIINGSLDEVPSALFTQLAEGGCLLAVMRHFGPAKVAHTGEARLYTKIQGQISSRALFDANVKPLPEFASKPAFTF